MNVEKLTSQRFSTPEEALMVYGSKIVKSPTETFYVLIRDGDFWSYVEAKMLSEYHAQRKLT